MRTTLRAAITIEVWGRKPLTQPPNWRTKVSILVWAITLTCQVKQPGHDPRTFCATINIMT